MEVEIKAKHLKGNSWEHQMNPAQRMCPLYEALQEVGSNVRVGGFSASVGNQLYKIDNVWGPAFVEDLIKRADNGSEESFFLTLKPVIF